MFSFNNEQIAVISRNIEINHICYCDNISPLGATERLAIDLRGNIFHENCINNTKKARQFFRRDTIIFYLTRARKEEIITEYFGLNINRILSIIMQENCGFYLCGKRMNNINEELVITTCSHVFHGKHFSNPNMECAKCHIGRFRLRTTKQLLQMNMNRYESEYILINLPPIPEYNIDLQLCIASRRNNLNEVNRLIKEGADINYIGVDGITPLAWAVRNGNKDIVKKLMNETKINANIVILDNNESQDYTALKIAIANEDEEMIDLLIDDDHGTNINEIRGSTYKYITDMELVMQKDFHDETIRILQERAIHPM